MFAKILTTFCVITLIVSSYIMTAACVGDLPQKYGDYAFTTATLSFWLGFFGLVKVMSDCE